MKILVLLLLGIMLAGCSLLAENHKPELLKVVTDLSTRRGVPVELTIQYVAALDRDADPLTLVVEPGDGYTCEGTVVTPDPDFVGTLDIGLRLSDGTDLSNMKVLHLKVVDFESIFPLKTGNYWEFRDSIAGDTTHRTSHFTVDAPEKGNGVSAVTYRCLWENLDSLDLSLVLSEVPDSGIYLEALYAPTDSQTIDMPWFRYPVAPGDTWLVANADYSLSDESFVVDTLSMTCTDTAKFVEVPAGIFKCIEYTVESNAPLSRSALGPMISLAGGTENPKPLLSRASAIFIMKFWLAPGIGYIGYEYQVGGVVKQTKSLVEYHVQ